MIRITRLPEEGARLLVPLKPYCSYRHYLVFCGLLVAHLVCFGKATVQGLARYTPRHVAAWHLRRLLAAGRWQWARVLEGWVSEALAAFPPPQEGVLYLVVDSTLKEKRSKKNPLAKKGRLNMPPTPVACTSSSSSPRGRCTGSPWPFGWCNPKGARAINRRLPSFGRCSRKSFGQRGARRWWW
jgi:hypothetical protein